MGEHRILVAGIGNIFLGDDAFGCEVVRRLSQRTWPQGVRVFDFGIRGFDLAYALTDGYETAILVDATPRGDVPGTLYVLEPDLNNLGGAEGEASAEIDTHGMNPLKVLRLVQRLGGQPGHIMVVGCEPTPLTSEDEGVMGLSEPVQAVVDEAARLVESLVYERLA